MSDSLLTSDTTARFYEYKFPRVCLPLLVKKHGRLRYEDINVLPYMIRRVDLFLFAFFFTCITIRIVLTL